MERWVSRYFEDWLEEAQRLEKERQANAPVMTHPGFGRADEESAFIQWFEYVAELNEGLPDEDEPDAEPHLVPEDEDED